MWQDIIWNIPVSVLSEQVADRDRDHSISVDTWTGEKCATIRNRTGVDKVKPKAYFSV